MDPETAKKLIEGHEDVLTPKAEAERKFYDSLQCPRCAGNIRREMDILVSDDLQVSTRFLARCLECGCLFNPDLGLIIEMGNLGRLKPAIPIIHSSSD